MTPHAAWAAVRRRNPAWIVLIVSGGTGFAAGMLLFPEWQVAVETAQVVAGIVDYPSATPAYIYHTKLWTLLHQVLAVLLRLGLSEIDLSLLVSGLLGLVSFMALSMFVYALSSDALLAIVAAPVIAISRLAEFGVVYPVFLMGTPHTYGSLGLSLFVLVVSLLGAGWYRSGAFLLGLAPAVHPSLGLWLFVVVALCLLWDVQRSRILLRQAGGYLIAGGAVTALSLAIQFAFITDAPAIDDRTAAAYLSRFIEVWDVHRQPVSLQADGVYLNAAAFGLAVVWLGLFTHDLPAPARFVLRVVVTAAVLSAAFIWVTGLPPSRVPATLLVLMPARVLNFNAMMFVALLIGLAGAYRTGWSPIILVLFTTALLLSPRSMVWDWTATEVNPRWLDPVETWRVFKLFSALLIGLALVNRFVVRNDQVTTESRQTAGAAGSRFQGVLRAMVAIPLLFLASYTWDASDIRPMRFVDRTNDPLFRVASEGEGLLLSGGNLFLIQLRTRRPILVDGGGLDGLPYSLEAAPVTERILRDVYGIDFFNPPAEARHTGTIPPGYNKNLWERLPPARWREIGRDFKVANVITTADWTLNLPVAVQSRDLRLWDVPAQP